MKQNLLIKKDNKNNTQIHEKYKGQANPTSGHFVERAI